MNRQKWIEGTKVVYHPAWLKRFREDPFSVPPIYLEISPAGGCNHRCTFCAPEMLGYVIQFLDVNVLKDRLQELKQMREDDPDHLGVRSIQYAGEGEPTLHKHLGRILEYTRDADIDVGMLTNATGLNEKRLPDILPFVNGYLQVSINAGTKSSYAKIHQTDERDWDLIWKNLENAVRMKENLGIDCDMGANMTILVKDVFMESGKIVPANWRPGDSSEIEALIKRAKDTGLNYVSFKPYSQHPYSQATMKLYGDMTYKNMMDEIVDTGARLTQEYGSSTFEVIFRFSRFSEYEDPERGYAICRATPTIWGYIQSDGVFISCTAHWTNKDFHLGNINKQSFRDIWYGERRRQHLDYVLNELDISICRKTCHPDKENRFFNQVAGMNDEEFQQELVQLRDIPRPKRANFI